MGKAFGDLVGDTVRPVPISGTKNTSGDNELIAAPGVNWRIVVTAFVIQNESATATTMILKGGTAEKWRILAQTQGDGLAMNLSLYPWRLVDNTALVLNLSASNSCGYSISYFVERTGW